ncbi:MAG: YfhO family protein [Vicingaceae bacterium]
MNAFQDALKKHGISFLIILIAIVLYFYPAFTGKELIQDDITRSMATSKEIRDYREATGEEPLWTNAQFSGMPAYQMNTEYPNNWLINFEKIKRIFPSQTGLFVVLALGFYFLLITLKIDHRVAIVGTIALTFSTFFIISFAAGHNSKLRAIGYIAPVIAGVLMALNGKKLLGFALTALFFGLSLNANHFQISYYTAILIGIIGLVYLYYSFKEKTVKHLVIRGVILSVALGLAVGPNISRIWTTTAYAKETIRGGKSELTSDKKQTTGLDWEYAMSWSYSKFESFTLLIPNIMGGSSTGSLDENSETFKALTQRGVPRAQAKQYIEHLPLYFGEQPFTSGPTYVGAIICFLFVLGMFIVKGPIKWWIFWGTLIALILAWGKHFFLNEYIFNYLPFYNKFRAPSMTLTLVCITMPLMAVLALNEILKNPKNENLKKPLLYAAGITGGLCLLFLMFAGGIDVVSANDINLEKQGWPVDALQQDRIGLIRSSALKSLVLIIAAFGLIWMFMQDKLKQTTLIAIIGVLIFGDLWVEDKKYLGNDLFKSPRQKNNIYAPTAADNQILQDKDLYYRVYNLSVNPFTDALTSYHHKSIGGYHAVKLQRYQDLIERQLSKNNEKVLNMLNAKYFILPDKQNGGTYAQQNPNALGNAWFVKNIKWVKNADEEMDGLNSFNPKEEVLIDERYKEKVNTKIGANGNIKLTSYKPNELIYKASVADENVLAVFSEIYYEGGHKDWKSYIDGKEKEHFRVNYLLRGMNIPKGEHEIKFVFHPKSYYDGEKYSLTFSILILLVVIGSIGWELKTALKKE